MSLYLFDFYHIPLLPSRLPNRRLLIILNLNVDNALLVSVSALLGGLLSCLQGVSICVGFVVTLVSLRDHICDFGVVLLCISTAVLIFSLTIRLLWQLW